VALIGTVRGVSGRDGVFLTGRPQQLAAFDDGLVLVRVSGTAAPLGGPLAGSIVQRQVAAAAGDTAADLAGRLKRATLLHWDQVEGALLEARYPGRRLTLTVAGRPLQHKFGKLQDEGDWLPHLLAARLGDRFRDTRSTEAR